MDCRIKSGNDERVIGVTSSSVLSQALLAPRSVAIVGQSDDAGKTAGRPLKYLRQAGFVGAIYPVNPRRDTVLGERAWRSIDALPEVPDHAYVVVPTAAVVDAVADCARAGVPVATILADGFTPADEGGVERAAQLAEICERTGIRLVGPSSLGVVDLRTKLFLTANAAFVETDLPVGRIFAASHSGSLIGALVSRGKARGIGFAGLVSVGNEIDLPIGEICCATIDDPTIDGYALFLETMHRADALRIFAQAAAARGKPVVAYKLGRSSVARELAISHTGALAGEDDVAGAFLAACGIVRVDTFEALIEALPLVTRLPVAPSKEPTVAVVTTTAGGAAMVVDRLGAAGVRIEGPSAATLARLATAGIRIAPGRLIDLTVTARYEATKATLDILTTAPEFDLVVAVVGSSARFHPDIAVRPIIDSANAGKPIVAFIVPEAPDALLRLADAGVPSFRTPEACADAVAATLRRRPPQAGRTTTPTSASGNSHQLDELESFALIDKLGIARVPAVALDADTTRAPELPFPYPVAVKVLSRDIAHKSDVGGVALNVANADGLLTAICTIRDNVARVVQAQPSSAYWCSRWLPASARR
jgi:acyl-CoA synthetase (NDP forming)